jgi:phosphoribosylglycinamide formyltransferase-1
MEIIIICSTNASVTKRVVNAGVVNNQDIKIISDRECGAISFAKEKKLEYEVLESSTGREFSEKLAVKYEGRKDILFISFYTKLFYGSFIKEHSTRLINFHPSILPSCPGMDGFGDTLKSGAMFIGSTVHFVDYGVDTGMPILQAAFPRSPLMTVKELRHRVYLQQSICLLQIIVWFQSGRVNLNADDRMIIKNAKYDVGEFSPNIDREMHDLFEAWLLE